MTQTTNAITLNMAVVQISTSGWPTGALDISGIANTVTISGGDLAIIKKFTFGTSTPVIAAGTKDSLKLKVDCLYGGGTAGTGDNYATLAAMYENKTPIQLRYGPMGSTSGYVSFVTGTGYMTGHPYPSGDAEGKEFATFSPNFEVQSITRSTF